MFLGYRSSVSGLHFSGRGRQYKERSDIGCWQVRELLKLRVIVCCREERTQKCNEGRQNTSSFEREREMKRSILWWRNNQGALSPPPTLTFAFGSVKYMYKYIYYIYNIYLCSSVTHRAYPLLPEEKPQGEKEINKNNLPAP